MTHEYSTEYSTEPKRRSAGPAIAAAVAGVLLGAGVAFGAAAMADSSQLPSDEEIAVSTDTAFLGSVQYGGRVAN